MMWHLWHIEAAMTLQLLLVDSDAPNSADIVRIDLNEGRSTEARASVNEAIARVAKLLDEKVLQDADSFAELVVGVVKPSDDLIKERIARRKTVNALTAETEWYTASDLADAGMARDWKRRRRVFAVAMGGKDFYPAYQFDDAMRPRPAIARILRAFGPVGDPWKLVAWFHYPNGWLVEKNDPQRRPQAPKDFLDDEDAVVQAARKLGNTYVA
jgi:hypothetical protein